MAEKTQDEIDAFKLTVLHTEIVRQWLGDLGHDPRLDSLAEGAINGHVAVCRAMKIPDAEIRRGIIAALDAVIPVS